jgi:DNA-binding NarL/FixJ family response regulator
MIDAIIAEDHPLVRKSLCFALTTAGDIRVVAEVADGDAAIEVASRVPAHIILLDYSLPGLAGIDLIREIRQQTPELPILMLSMESSPDIVSQALAAGAAGYVSKGAKLDVLIEGIRNVAGGGFFIDPMIEPYLA